MIKLKDSHYTPISLADRLLSYTKTLHFNSIADFCVGNGSLLISAKKYWPNSSFYASDISKKVINNLKQRFPEWNYSICDFTKYNSRNKAKIFTERFDLILLNPPFSCKGSSTKSVIFDNIEYKVSTAMEFLLISLKYLSTQGVLLAIMPVSVAYSQKDRLIWKKLKKDYKLQILEQPNDNFFEGCSPNIILVSLNLETTSNIDVLQNSISHNIPEIELFRGKISMHQVKYSDNGEFFFIHSTNLRNNKLENLSKKVSGNYSKICGPAILIPRVGTLNPNKIVIINKGACYILSDCIIGLIVLNDKQALTLFNVILDNWVTFKNLYQGTGAKYITLERLGVFFNLSKKQYLIKSIQQIDKNYKLKQPNIKKPAENNVYKAYRSKL